MKIYNFLKRGVKYGLPLLIGCTIMAGPLMAQQKTHEVKAGETLFSIAKSNNITVQQLREWNNLEGNQLRIGQVLLVTNPEGSDIDTVVHEVEPQETLFSISKEYRVSIAEIKQWNNLEDNALKIGQSLVIHTGEAGKKDLSDTGGTTSLVENRTESANTYYTVKSGDTLFEIAREHGMSVADLKNLNDLASDVIRVGQVLTVRSTTTAPSVAANATKSSPQGNFVVYRLEQSQSMDELLRKFNMSRSEFAALNPEQSRETFRAGQKVTVITPPSKTYENPYRVNADLKDLGKTPVTVYDTTAVGSPTTSGELYNPGELTAAHSNISMGSIIFVRNPSSGKGIYVRINDRISTEGLKLSRAAYRALEFKDPANASVNIFQDQ